MGEPDKIASSASTGNTGALAFASSARTARLLGALAPVGSWPGPGGATTDALHPDPWPPRSRAETDPSAHCARALRSMAGSRAPGRPRVRIHLEEIGGEGIARV